MICFSHLLKLESHWNHWRLFLNQKTHIFSPQHDVLTLEPSITPLWKFISRILDFLTGHGVEVYLSSITSYPRCDKHISHSLEKRSFFLPQPCPWLHGKRKKSISLSQNLLSAIMRAGEKPWISAIVVFFLTGTSRFVWWHGKSR